MANLDFRQPDEEAMNKLLEDHGADRTAVVLRLAWHCGLTREEIAELSWDQVGESVLRLPDREVPLPPEDAACLALRREKQEGTAVVPTAPQSISRLARRALDEAGQHGVRLLDLRLDYVRRLLSSHDWPYVLRVSGYSVNTYRTQLSRLWGPENAPAEPPGTESNELKLWKLLNAQRSTPAGLALRLSRDLGLRTGELAALTWELVDLDGGILRLPDREAALSQGLRNALREERERRREDDDPHVFLSSRSRKPLSAARLSALVREALIRGGLEGMTLEDLRRESGRGDERRRLLDYVRKNGSITRREAAELLNLSPTEAYGRLRELVKQGELLRLNRRCCLPGTAVPAEKQAEAVREFIRRYGAAYRQDAAELLRVSPQAASRLLRRMTERGELLRDAAKRYTLPPEE